MKVSLICGVFSAALFGVLGLETTTTTDVGKQPYGIQDPITYALPTTTPVTLTTHNYLPHWSNYDKPFEAPALCNYEVTDQTILDYRHALYNMTTPINKRASELTGAHFVLSPYTIWLTVAALAEGSSGKVRQQLFKYLGLPEDVCLRQIYYQLATERKQSSDDIVFAKNRLFIADSSIHVNKKWEDYVKTHTHLNTVSVPFKTNPSVEIEELKKIFKVNLPNINLSGNSIILESLDYHSLWTSAFSDAVIQDGPFYNSFEEQIGVLEYMKTTKRVNIGVIPQLHMKVMDLPVGRDGRYHMFFGISLAKKENFETFLAKIDNTVLFETVLNLKQSLVPVEIVIPKMTMTSEFDVRQILEDVGVSTLWTDPLATRNVSEPAALPSAFTQRVTVTINNGGVRPAIQEYHNFVPPLHYSSGFVKPKYTGYPSYTGAKLAGIEEPLQTSFIANKPFLFGLFDSETMTSLITATFSKVQH